MPELPDVEGFRRVLARNGAGKRIDDVRVLDSGVLEQVGAGRLGRELSGRTLVAPRRHGKWLLAPLRSGRRHQPDEPTLVFHFGMTGSLLSASPEEARHPHDRVLLELGGRELRYRDLRKLQGIRLAANDDQVAGLLRDLGPDANDVPAAEFRERLQAKRSALKAALMDQTVVAGLGNLLADEILWRARLRPTRRSNDLSDPELSKLHRSMRTVLRASIQAGRVPPKRGWLTARRDDSEAICPRCGTKLRRSRVAGRSTVWCPNCQ
ncbi:Fpg/Nei family DNA glycosylase [Flindersiella endophytica]